MKKLILTFFLSVVSLTATSKEWYEGGNLHNKNMQAWCAATEENKLATAADIVAISITERMFTSEIIEEIDKAGEEGIKMVSIGLVKALDKAACKNGKAIDALKDKSVNEMTILIYLDNGWAGW